MSPYILSIKHGVVQNTPRTRKAGDYRTPKIKTYVLAHCTYVCESNHWKHLLSVLHYNYNIKQLTMQVKK